MRTREDRLSSRLKELQKGHVESDDPPGARELLEDQKETGRELQKTREELGRSETALERIEETVRKNPELRNLIF